eukprot:g5834.t1
MKDFYRENYGRWRGKPTASPVQKAKARNLDEEDDALLEAAEREFEMAAKKKKEQEIAAKKKMEEEKAQKEQEAAENEAKEEIEDEEKASS